MKYAIAILALSLSLMGATCQDQLRANLTRTCAGLDVIYAHYDGVAATGAIPAKYMGNVNLARAQSDRVCANPGAATTVSVTAAAAQAYLALNAAFKASRTNADSQMGYTKLHDLKRIVDAARKN